MYNLPQVNEATIRSCSGPVLRSLMTWSVSVLCPVREGVGLRPWRVGYGKVRVLYGTGVGGAVPVLDDGTCTGGDLVEGKRVCGCPRGRGQPDLWSWSPSMWRGTPLSTATFPHDLVQSRRRIRLRGRRWRVASYQRKVVEMDPFQPPPEGPRGAGGDPAPGNVATTRLPGAGVRDHPAPLGALRPATGPPWAAPSSSQGPPRTARCIKTTRRTRSATRRRRSRSTPHR